MNNLLISKYFLLIQNIFTFFNYMDDDLSDEWNNGLEDEEENKSFYPKEDSKNSKDNKKSKYIKEYEENLSDWGLEEEEESEEEEEPEEEDEPEEEEDTSEWY